MTRRLLNLSFHQVGTIFAEDLLFKKSAMAAGSLGQPFITSDALDESPPPQSLVQRTAGDQAGGLMKGTKFGVSAWSLQPVMAATWALKPYRPDSGRSDFEQWFSKLILKPIEVLVVGGHHSIWDRPFPLVWGVQWKLDNNGKEPQTGFHPLVQSGTPYIAFRTLRRVTDQPVYVSFNAATCLSACRMVVVLGCSGTALGNQWQAWVAAAHAQGKKPLVLGWYGTHEMPKDRYGEHFSERFWTKVRALLANGSTASLTSLIDTRPDEVIRAWGAALKETYRGTGNCQTHLWFGEKATGKCKNKRDTGAGAIEPSGQMWAALTRDGDIARVQ